ncbi:hypothetical protein [Sphingobium lactosutens]|uniref:hypothetical protein n=1 Tax=Sphingobium lactosutens TaxID=522773 RepID=UPI00068E0E44|nr:hypothetical protein [Sphingobium lactosutens]
MIGPDDGIYYLGKGEIEYKAPAELIWDNLLDFSHLGYVHATSFGATDAWGKTRPIITSLETGIRADRWVLDQPPLFSEGRVDQWFTYDFLVPGILILKTFNFPLGTAEKYGLTEPPVDEAWLQNSYSVHAITPVTDRTARYFFTFGPHVEGSAPELGDKFLEVAHFAFAEDQAIIEAQARTMSEFPGVRPMPTSADRGITLFHGIVNKALKAEQSAVHEPSL